MYPFIFQCYSSETHQGCSRETYPIRVPRHSYQSHNPGETRGGAPPCARPYTDFSLPHCGGSSVPHQCFCWGQFIQFIDGLTGQSEPGVRQWGEALASSWDTGHTSALRTGVTLFCFFNPLHWFTGVMSSGSTYYFKYFCFVLIVFVRLYRSKPRSPKFIYSVYVRVTKVEK